MTFQNEISHFSFGLNWPKGLVQAGEFLSHYSQSIKICLFFVFTLSLAVRAVAERGDMISRGYVEDPKEEKPEDVPETTPEKRVCEANKVINNCEQAFQYAQVFTSRQGEEESKKVATIEKCRRLCNPHNATVKKQLAGCSAQHAGKISGETLMPNMQNCNKQGSQLAHYKKIDEHNEFEGRMIEAAREERLRTEVVDAEGRLPGDGGDAGESSRAPIVEKPEAVREREVAQEHFEHYEENSIRRNNYVDQVCRGNSESTCRVNAAATYNQQYPLPEYVPSSGGFAQAVTLGGRETDFVVESVPVPRGRPANLGVIPPNTYQPNSAPSTITPSPAPTTDQNSGVSPAYQQPTAANTSGNAYLQSSLSAPVGSSTNQISPTQQTSLPTTVGNRQTSTLQNLNQKAVSRGLSEVSGGRGSEVAGSSDGYDGPSGSSAYSGKGAGFQRQGNDSFGGGGPGAVVPGGVSVAAVPRDSGSGVGTSSSRGVTVSGQTSFFNRGHMDQPLQQASAKNLEVGKKKLKKNFGKNTLGCKKGDMDCFLKQMGTLQAAKKNKKKKNGDRELASTDSRDSLPEGVWRGYEDILSHIGRMHDRHFQLDHNGNLEP